MNDDVDDSKNTELNDDEEALVEEMPTLRGVGITRRAFIGYTIEGSLGVFALSLLAEEEALAAISTSPEAIFAANPVGENLVKVTLKI